MEAESSTSLKARSAAVFEPHSDTTTRKGEARPRQAVRTRPTRRCEFAMRPNNAAASRLGRRVNSQVTEEGGTIIRRSSPRRRGSAPRGLPSRQRATSCSPRPRPRLPGCRPAKLRAERHRRQEGAERSTEILNHRRTPRPDLGDRRRTHELHPALAEVQTAVDRSRCADRPLSAADDDTTGQHRIARPTVRSSSVTPAPRLKLRLRPCRSDSLSRCGRRRRCMHCSLSRMFDL